MRHGASAMNRDKNKPIANGLVKMCQFQNSQTQRKNHGLRIVLNYEWKKKKYVAESFVPFNRFYSLCMHFSHSNVFHLIPVCCEYNKLVKSI